MLVRARSSLSLMDVGRLCAYTGSSCFSVNLILISVFMPISSQCREKMLWYLTRRLSICWRSCPSKMELSHWKLAKNAGRCCSSTGGSSFSSSRSLTISSKILLSIRFNLDGLSQVSGVGYQRQYVFPLVFWNIWLRTFVASSG